MERIYRRYRLAVRVADKQKSIVEILGSSAPSIPESGGLFPESTVLFHSHNLNSWSVNRIIAYVGEGGNRYIGATIEVYVLNYG